MGRGLSGRIKPYKSQKGKWRYEMKFSQFILEAINYPEVRQSMPYSCGAACIQSVIGYYEGESPREETIMKEVNTTREGTLPENIRDYFKERKYKVVFKKKMTLEELFGYLDKKIPVIVAIQAWGEEGTDYEKDWDDGHYVVALSYDDKKIYFEDPVLPVKAYLTHKEFELRWHDRDDNGLKYQHLGIAVYGKKPKFDIDEIVHMD